MIKRRSSSKQSHKRERRHKRRFFIICGLLVLGWCGWIGVSSWQALRHGRAAQAALQSQPLRPQALETACAQLGAAGGNLRTLRTLTLPITPLLRHSSWVPKLGPLLSSTPALLDSGSAGADLLDYTCAALAPVWPALEAPAEQRLAAILRALQPQPPDWNRLQQLTTQLAQAWAGMPPSALERWPFASYPQLQQLAPTLRDSQQMLQLAQPLWPALPTLLGLERPVRWLVVAQNPGELRPTGGFIGSLALITLDQGQLTASAYYNSSLLGAAAPAGSAMPAPYNDYLRASIWTLRDANWWPDWPRSARIIETFWELNEQPAVDGVIAVNLYALEALLPTLGSIEVPNYGTVSAAAGLETIYSLYEGQDQLTSNKDFLGALFQATLQRLLTASPQQLPSIAAGLYSALDSRQISLWLHDDAAQQAITAAQWDGSQPALPADRLQVIDADLSYSDVQPFIDERMALTVRLNQQGQPISSTLIITYTNHYDDWNAAQTQHQVFGYCYNVATQLQERIPGCYGNYVRIYLPPQAAVSSVHGNDGPLTVERSAQFSSVGMYLRLLPGATRQLRIDYTPQLSSAAGDYRLDVLKQAGTFARPLALTLIDSTGQTLAADIDLWRDRTLSVSATTGGLQWTQPLPPLHPAAQAQLTRARSWEQGWQLWPANQAAALRQWQQTGTLEQSLDQVTALRWQGELEQAAQLLAALEREMPTSARAAFLRGQLAEEQGSMAEAISAYQTALERDPQADVARLALALLQSHSGQTAAAIATLQQMQEPKITLRRRAFDARLAGDVAAADQLQALILALDPADQMAWEERYWLARFSSDQPRWEHVLAIAQAASAQAPTSAVWSSRRAEAQQALGNTAAALADWQQTTSLSPTNALAWYNQGLIQRKLNDISAATYSIEQAVKVSATPDINFLVVLADLYVEQERTAEARHLYAQALQLQPERDDLQQTLDLLGE